MNNYVKWGLFALAGILIYHFELGGNDVAPSANVSAPTQGPLPLTQVKYWAYQIQDLALQGAGDALVDSTYDMVVVDPTRTDWTEDSTQNFDTAALVTKLKASPSHDGFHRKLVMAYIDIGEAENWRWYWTWSKTWTATQPRPADWPSYIIPPSPDTAGNDYAVAFWDPEWKDIVIYGKNHPAPSGDQPNPGHRNYTSIIDEAIRDGFDGIYLDWTEAYRDDRVAAAAESAGLDPAAEMAKFIAEMRKYTRERNPNFLIIQHNGSDLIGDHPEITESVDAIGQEAIWNSGDIAAEWDAPTGYDQPVDPLETEDILQNLKLYRAAGKPVFDLEYAVKKAAPAYKLSLANGLVPYCTRAALDQLTDTPPPGM